LGLARGCLGRPWLFEEIKQEEVKKKSREEIFQIAWQHALLTQKHKGEAGIIELRKHLPWYIRGLEGAKNLRQQLVRIKGLKGIKNIFDF